MINSRVLNLSDLKIVRKGLKECIKKSKKLDKSTNFDMRKYRRCALGTMYKCQNYEQFKDIFLALFEFYPHITASSLKSDPVMHTIYKMVNSLFTSGSFECESIEGVTLKVWRKKAKWVLKAIDRQIDKFD